jgi:O-antigen/teichoic acid export membrane protein
MRLAFGPAFVPAAAVLQLMLPGVFALGTTTVLSQYLAAIGVPRITIAVWVVALVSALGLGRLLIPSHAGAGAAVALSITYWILLVLVFATAIRYRDLEPSSALESQQPLELPEPSAGPV